MKDGDRQQVSLGEASSAGSHAALQCVRAAQAPVGCALPRGLRPPLYLKGGLLRAITTIAKTLSTETHSPATASRSATGARTPAMLA